MTEKQLRKFIKIRNASNFQSNMQFNFDAEAAGFRATDLGKPTKKQKEDGTFFYWWNTPFGILVERFGVLRLFTRQQKKQIA